jgi:hypothetical protein
MISTLFPISAHFGKLWLTKNNFRLCLCLPIETKISNELNCKKYCRRQRVCPSLSVSDLSAVNPLVALKTSMEARGVTFPFFCPEHHTGIPSFSYPYPTKWGRSVQHVFYHVVIKIRQLFLRPAACLTSTLLKTGVGAIYCKCNWDQRLNVPSGTRRSWR